MEAAKKTVYIGLGSNLGDRRENIENALKILSGIEGIELVRKSEMLETIPLAGHHQPGYLNTVAELKTSLTAKELLKKTGDIEVSFGRTRKVRWAPRTIDIDLLLFGDEVIKRSGLIVPHPQMHLRTFVLKGLCELNRGLEHPEMKVSVGELLTRLNGRDFIPDRDKAQLVCVAGVIGVGKTTLAKKLSGLLNCPLLLEPYDKNPYMPDVYAGKKELALDSQLFFLTHRVEQLNQETFEQGRIYVTDYVFDKEIIYALLQLNKEQLELYNKLYDKLSPAVSQPVLVIYLFDSEDNCLQRIHKRNRPYEQQIEVSLLSALTAGYERLFNEWDKCPVIRIGADKLDYGSEDFFNQFINQINCYTNVKST